MLKSFFLFQTKFDRQFVYFTVPKNTVNIQNWPTFTAVTQDTDLTLTPKFHARLIYILPSNIIFSPYHFLSLLLLLFIITCLLNVPPKPQRHSNPLTKISFLLSLAYGYIQSLTPSHVLNFWNLTIVFFKVIFVCIFRGGSNSKSMLGTRACCIPQTSSFI